MKSIGKCALVGAMFGAVLIAPAWAQFERSGAYLGVEMEDVTAANMSKYQLTSEKGVIVRSVSKGSPAETAGLQEGDVILDYSGIPVLSAAQLARMVQETPAGRKVDLSVSRAGKQQTLTATLGKRDFPAMGRMDVMPEFRGFGFRAPDGTFRFEIPEGRGFGFALPAPRRRLGVTLEPLTEQMRSFLGAPSNRGVLVTAVSEGSAASGKLQAGDVILKAGGEEISSVADLQRVLERSGGKVDLTIIRNKKEAAVTVETGDGGSYRL